MALRQLVVWPDKRLNQKSEPVAEVTEDIRNLAADMLETMYAAHGVGIAAPQVGVHVRLIIVDANEPGKTGRHRSDAPLFMVNPVILDSEGSVTAREGCLSVPGVYEPMKRSKSVLVRYKNLEGEPLVAWFDGLWAVAVQHEIEHLEGMTMMDRLSPLKRELAKKKVKKFLTR